MSELFNLNYLVEDSHATSDIISLDTLVEKTNVSYTSMALRFLSESNKMYNLASKVLYKSIIESNGNVDVINESFDSFFENVKNIIDKFLKFVKSLFDRFLTALNRLIQSDKHLLKNLSKLDKFNDSQDKFTFIGYEYTINDTIPALNALATFSMGFVTGGEVPTAANIKSLRNNLEESLRNDYYDDFRAQVLNKTNQTILQSEFDNKLFMEYRNGDNSTKEIEVTRTEVMIASDRFKNHKSIESRVKRDRDRVKKEYEAIKKLVENVYKREHAPEGAGKLNLPSDSNITGVQSITLSREAMLEFDLFVKAKTNQVQEMSAIHLLAFSAKLDAIAECYKQDRAMLYRALDKVQKVRKEA